MHVPYSPQIKRRFATESLLSRWRRMALVDEDYGINGSASVKMVSYELQKVGRNYEDHSTGEGFRYNSECPIPSWSVFVCVMKYVGRVVLLNRSLPQAKACWHTCLFW